MTTPDGGDLDQPEIVPAGYFIPVVGYERCRIALGYVGDDRVWRVECGYCGLVTEWAKRYAAHAEFLHLRHEHDMGC